MEKDRRCGPHQNIVNKIRISSKTILIILCLICGILLQSTSVKALEVEVLTVEKCPADITELKHDQACIFTQDWDSYEKGVRRYGCILRTVYPGSNRANDNFIGKWVYLYNTESRAWKIQGIAREEGYYQHDTQVGNWLSFNPEGSLISSENFEFNRKMPLYECVLSE